MKKWEYVLEEKTVVINKFGIFLSGEREVPFKDVLNSDFKLNLEEIYSDLVEYENNNAYMMCDLSLLKANTCILVSTVYARKKEYVFFEMDVPGRGKLYVNGDLVYVCCTRQEKEYFCLELVEGLNYITYIYYGCGQTILPPYIYYQIYPRYAISGVNVLPNGKKIFLTLKICIACLYQKEKNKFLVMPIGLNTKKRDVFIEIFYNDISCFKGKVNMLEVFSISFPENDLFQISISIPGVYERKVIYTYIEKGIENEIISGIKDRRRLSKNDKGRIEKVSNELIYIEDKYNLLRELSSAGKYEDCSYQRYRRMYYLSKIDRSYQEITLCFPRQFEAEREYPVVFCLGILDFDFFYPEKNTGFIIVNIAGRGILGGSYLSETCYLEAMEVVLGKFNCDRSKIYLTGKSNGGYAVWSLLQKYPDKFAAAFPISGYPDMEEICNVSNVCIKNYISDLDVCYMNKEKEIEGCCTSGHYYPRYISGMLHHSLSEFWWFDILGFFEDKKLEKYPFKIDFTTARNYYRKSFWIKIYKISFGKKRAFVHAEYDSNKIMIQTENVDGIEIEIPEMLLRAKMVVIINREQICFERRGERFLYFLIHDDKVSRCKKFGDDIDLCKGLGLLHIYMDYFTVVIDDFENREAYQVALQFSKPKSSGYYNRLSVRYPCIDISGISDEIKKKGIIFVNVMQKEIAKLLEIDFSLYVSCEEDHFCYMGEKYYGDYCVLQIVHNPNDKSKSILVIYANKKSLYRKNMFCRKVILPFFSAGLHEYWNNEALIFRGGKYYSIYEWGTDIKEIR